MNDTAITSQETSSKDIISELYRHLLWDTEDNIIAVWGYGSLLVPQAEVKGETEKEVKEEEIKISIRERSLRILVDPILSLFKEAPQMADVILVVQDPKTFYKRMKQEGHSDFFPMFPIGSAFFQGLIQNQGAGINYYHIDLPDSGIRTKIGVISESALTEDLENWTHLYVAGRRHKPMREVFARDGRLEASNERNLRSAFLIGLLLLGQKESFTSDDLLRSIIQLSYTNDPRKKGFEAGDKIEKILEAQREVLLDMYRPFFSEALNEEIIQEVEKDLFMLDFPKLCDYMMETVLPESIPFLNFQNDSAREAQEADEAEEGTESEGKIFVHKMVGKVGQRVGEIVNSGAIVQTAKGALTVSFQHQMEYVKAKREKGKK